MAAFDDDGVLHVTSATQGTFYTRSELARLFGLPIAAVRVTGATIGGGFGGKVMVVEPLAAGAALALRRPVRLELTRHEDMRMTNPAPGATLDVRIGATRDGRLRALSARLQFETGAFAENSIEGIAAIMTVGPYRWDAHEVVAYGVETNRVGTGAYRAPGAPQATFALEQLVDELAGRLGIDPIELRQRNLVGPDDEMADGTPWGEIGLCACLDRHRRASALSRPGDASRRRGRRASRSGRGRAVASRRPRSAASRRTAGSPSSPASSTCRGRRPASRRSPRRVSGIAAGDVSVVDRRHGVRAPLAGHRRQRHHLFDWAGAVQRATEALRDKILAYAALLLEIDVSDLELVDGSVRPKGTPDRGLTLAADRRLTRRLHLRLRAARGPRRDGPAGPRPALGRRTSSSVRVDRETGAVRVLQYVIAQDVGRALNPAIIEGQLHGGATQGLGWALHEAMVYDERGQLLTGTFLDYAIPTAPIVPEFETIIVEVPAPDGPYGAKGIGEGPVCGASAAVANAVTDATGVRFRTPCR